MQADTHSASVNGYQIGTQSVYSAESTVMKQSRSCPLVAMAQMAAKALTWMYSCYCSAPCFLSLHNHEAGCPAALQQSHCSSEPSLVHIWICLKVFHASLTGAETNKGVPQVSLCLC